MIGTYAKATLPLVPGASKLPWIAGGGGDMPSLERRTEVRPDRDHVAEYSRVCGFRLRDTLPPTFPHILAFPLHMSVMTDGRFPFAPVGLVHLENSITVKRPIGLDEELEVIVTTGKVQPHPKGQTFSLDTKVKASGKIAWTEESTMLRRGKGTGDRKSSERIVELKDVAEWKLPGDLGRRYAAVSGDSNPIHMHPLSARLFGFPRAIAHGMWTKARSLAQMERDLPDAFTVEVEFKKPILLPAKVTFARAGEYFEVRSHLEGALR